MHEIRVVTRTCLWYMRATWTLTKLRIPSGQWPCCSFHIQSTIALYRILRTLKLSRFKLVYAAELLSLSLSCSQTVQYVLIFVRLFYVCFCCFMRIYDISKCVCIFCYICSHFPEYISNPISCVPVKINLSIKIS